MSIFDPENWLVTLPRALQAWVENNMPSSLAPDVQVEMDFPDTRQWPKQVPLAKVLIHFAQDDEDDPAIGFGVPGDYEFDDVAGTVVLREAAQHLVNYDVGVWSSANMGGITKRAEVTQVLKSLFTLPTAKKALEEEEGIWVVSFNGGRNELDRVGDVPIWRTLGMTLIVRVVSRHLPPTPVIVQTDYTQDQELTILVDDGTAEPVTTP
jgi:hypothetical protein